MPCVISPSFGKSTVFGLTAEAKRTAACTTKPSQWPEARAWFTMRAHAAASAVGIQGSAFSPTHTPFPNMVTKSFTSNVSTETELGKFGNENPSESGRMVVAMDSAFTSSPPLITKMVPASAITATTAPICLAPIPYRVTTTNAPAPIRAMSNTNNTYLPRPDPPLSSGLKSAMLICACSKPIDKGTGSPTAGLTITSITESEPPILSFVASALGSSFVHSCVPD